MFLWLLAFAPGTRDHLQRIYFDEKGCCEIRYLPQNKTAGLVVRMYVGWAQSGPCTATINDLLGFPFD
jgi:hypothetical protein